MSDDGGISIEETNKIRASLGLKPLVINDAPDNGKTEQNKVQEDAPLTSEQQERIAVENLRRRAEDRRQARIKEESIGRVQKARERLRRDRQLTGKTLADIDPEEVDTLSWLRTLGKKPSTGQVRENVPSSTYNDNDLEGLRVAHDLQEFEGGDDVILTLADRDVLADDHEDELVNDRLLEKEKLKHKLDSKKRKSVYAGFEDEEYDPSKSEDTPKILARYDEDAELPAKKSGFVIDSQSQRHVELPKQRKADGRVLQSLEPVDASTPISDYAAPLIRKRKRKEKVKKRLRQEDDDAIDIPKVDNEPILAEDEEQVLLRKQRDLISQHAIEGQRASPAIKVEADEEPPDEQPATGLVLDEASEFTRALTSIKAPEPVIERKRSVSEELQEVQIQAPGTEPEEPPRIDLPTTGIDTEATFDTGIGAAVLALRQKGALHEDDEESRQRRAREEWLAKDRKLRMELDQERQRVRDDLRNAPRFRSMSMRDKEAYAASENRRLDALEAKLAQERFKDYKPLVDIKYVDDFGRNMTQKEAFKHLSHQFHGKDSGSGKSAKKLAQIEKEKASEQKSFFR